MKKIKTVESALGMALQFAPVRQWVLEVCLAAVKGNGLAFAYAPEALRTRVKAAAALKREPRPTPERTAEGALKRWRGRKGGEGV
jgi:hypothetical protein